ncbi:MAG: ABC transporter substrate binding protein [Deferribacterales bacterium]
MITKYIVILLLFLSSFSVYADSSPVRRPDGEKWRIGYFESGDYPDYSLILSQIIRGMMNKGWVQKKTFSDKNFKTHAEFWKWICTNIKSEYVQFVPDAYYSSCFDPEKRIAAKKSLGQRIKTKKDLNLIIAMGTWAGQDMADKNMNVPTIVASTSDPIGSKIIKSATDSGFAHLHAKVEPDRYRKQVELFHSLTGFRKLGFIMEDSEEGRTYSAYNDIAALSKKLKFRMIICQAPFSGISQEQAEQNALSCYSKLVRQADAVYVTVHRGITDDNISKLVDILIKAKKPSFSQRGENEVAAGILMSVSQAGFSHAGAFHADVIAQIFHGKKPGSIPMIWNAPALIALNIATAEKIRWNPPFEILKAADRLYDSIK